MAAIPDGLKVINIDPNHAIHAMTTKIFVSFSDNFLLSGEIGDQLMDLGIISRQASTAEVKDDKALMTWLWNGYGAILSTQWQTSIYGKAFQIPDSDIFLHCFGNKQLYDYVRENKPLLLQSQTVQLIKNRDRLVSMVKKGINVMISGFNLSDSLDPSRENAKRRKVYTINLLSIVCFIFLFFIFIYFIQGNNLVALPDPQQPQPVAAPIVAEPVIAQPIIDGQIIGDFIDPNENIEDPKDPDYVDDDDDENHEGEEDLDEYDEAGFSDSFKDALLSHFPDVSTKGIYILFDNNTRKISSSTDDQTERYFADFTTLTGMQV